MRCKLRIVPDEPRPVVRCYSLSGSPEDRDFYRISVRRQGPPPSAGPDVPGGLSSNFFHNNIKEGDVIECFDVEVVKRSLD